MWNWIRKLFTVEPMKVDVHVDLGSELLRVRDETRKTIRTELLLRQWHEAYRAVMSDPEFAKHQGEFYRVAKDTATLLNIPLWGKMTLPLGMNGGKEPMLEHLKP